MRFKVKAMYIEVTNRCNLNCRICYNSSGCNTKTLEISPGDLKSMLLSFNREYGIKSFEISGGEVLLHTQINEILDVVEGLTDFYFQFITNGTLENKRFYDIIKYNERFQCQFSVDGIDEETHAKTRGPGYFEKTMEKIRYVNTKEHLAMKMILSKYNSHQIENYVNFVLENKCMPYFSFVSKNGNADTNWEDLDLPLEDKLVAIKLIDRLKKKHSLDLTVPLASTGCPFTDDEDKLELSLCIKPNGNIQPCQSFYDDAFAIGNIYELDFDKLTENFMVFRERILKRYETDFGCSDCINHNTCKKGCPASAYFYYRTLEAPDGMCEDRRKQTVHLVLPDAVKSFKKDLKKGLLQNV